MSVAPTFQRVSWWCSALKATNAILGYPSHAFFLHHSHIPSGRLISKDRIPQNQRKVQIDLCGSRGTGGVLTFGAPTCLNIFDLEEDEDSASSVV